MNIEHTPVSISLGNMPVTSDKTDTVLSKSDSITTGDDSTVNSFYSHPDNAIFFRKSFGTIKLAKLKLTDTPRDDGLCASVGTLSQPFTPKEIKLNEDINLVVCEDYVSVNNPDDKRSNVPYGVTSGSFSLDCHTGKTETCRSLFDEQLAQTSDALDPEKSSQEPGYAFYVNMVKRKDGKTFLDLGKTDGKIYFTKEDAQAAIDSDKETCNSRHVVELIAIFPE